MKMVNVGVIGCGAVAENYHFPALERVPRLNIVALSDIDKSRLNTMEKKFKLKEVFLTENYREILENPNVDAVMVLTPPNTHANITLESIKAGKHVFCEKPFILTMDEASKIIDALSNSKVKLMVGYNFRFHPHYAKIKTFLEEGVIGKAIMVNTIFFSNVKTWPSVTGFQFKKEMGGGALFEMGCHHIDLLRWIVGEVKAVQAVIWNLDESMAADDNALAWLYFKNGAMGSVNISWSTSNLNRIEIFGEEGMMRADLSKQYMELFLHGKSIFKHGAIKIPAVSILNSYSLELNHFANCILKGVDPLVGAEDGIEVMKIISACYMSARIGQKIDLYKR